MNTNLLRSKIVVALTGILLAVSLSVSLPTTAHAQQKIQRTTSNAMSFQFEQTDVRDGLREVFKSAGVSYSIAPEVTGTVTVSVKNVTFETTLLNILRQVDATYYVQGGIYYVIRTKDAPHPNSGLPTQSTLPTLPETRQIIQDGRSIFIIDPQTITKIRKSDLKILGKTKL